MSDSDSGTFLGIINLSSIVAADGRHDGFFELHIGGMMINRKAAEHLEGSISINSVATVYASSVNPIIRVILTRGEDGPLNAREIKRVVRAFKQALKNWAESLTADQIDSFIGHDRPGSPVMAVYGDDIYARS